MKMTSVICHQCSKVFSIPSREYNRQIKNGRTYFFCSRSCSASKIQITTHDIKSNCLFCHKEFETTTHKKAHKCCSLDCAHKYAQSFVDTNKTSTSMKKAWERGDFDNTKIARVLQPRTYNFICVVCNKPFGRITRQIIPTVKTCSKKCFSELARKRARLNPNCGGDLGYKHYNYNNISMDSSWEVNLAKWMDKNNIRWDRSKKKYMLWWTDADGNKRRYYPDFYLPDYNVYLDPKNKYRMGLDEYKMEAVVKENGITLFWGLLNDVKKELDILRGV